MNVEAVVVVGSLIRQGKSPAKGRETLHSCHDPPEVDWTMDGN